MLGHSEKVGICKCSFFLDMKHLLKEKNMEKKFGRQAFHAVKYYVQDMVYAESVEVFYSLYKEAKRILTELSPRPADAEPKLDMSLAREKKLYHT